MICCRWISQRAFLNKNSYSLFDSTACTLISLFSGNCSSQTTRSPNRSLHSKGLVPQRIFNDSCRIVVRGGHGGNGCASRVQTRKGKGKADGEDGGYGGNVILRATNTLQSIRIVKHHFNARPGSHGRSRQMKGRKGKDIKILLPTGTVVHKIVESEDSWYDENYKPEYLSEVLVDLDHDGMELIVANGGKGGQGNMSLGHEMCTLGEPGETIRLMLELKTIADVGLVGWPNAGKSSLLAALSRATPKIASYAFTTLTPNIGVVHTPEDDMRLDRFTVADIPGLIEGAHEDIGLGHDFLRHIERTKVLLYVIDLAGIDGRNPLEDFQTLQKELRMYDGELYKKKSIVFCNKIDRKPKTCQRHLESIKLHTDMPVVSGSALKKKNLEELIETLTDTIVRNR